MKASEIIEKLETLINEHGDLEVVIHKSDDAVWLEFANDVFIYEPLYAKSLPGLVFYLE